MLTFSAIALGGAAWAQTNPMGAGLMVPAGEGLSPLLENEKIAIYAQPDLKAEKVGDLSASGDKKNPFQIHVITKEEADPAWKETWFRRMLKRSAPVITTTTPVSEFTLSDTQKGVMIVTVQGSWLQIAQGWLQWTTTLAEHAEFKAWSELYQEASFAAFQLSNARAGKADLVPLNEVPLAGVEGVKVAPPARFISLDARPEAVAVRVTGGTCKGSTPAKEEGKQGWVALFAQNGAPQLLLQPEKCPEDAAAK